MTEIESSGYSSKDPGSIPSNHKQLTTISSSSPTGSMRSDLHKHCTHDRHTYTFNWYTHTRQAHMAKHSNKMKVNIYLKTERR